MTSGNSRFGEPMPPDPIGAAIATSESSSWFDTWKSTLTEYTLAQAPASLSGLT